MGRAPMHGCLLICALFTEIQVIPVGKGLGLGLCVRRHARPKILTCGGTMLRAVFLLHICSNYYIYVVELTKALVDHFGRVLHVLYRYILLRLSIDI